jgi:hypothetical protein
MFKRMYLNHSRVAMVCKMKTYYPTLWSGCNPIHEVIDWAKVRRLIRAVRAGEYIPPVLIDGSIGNGNLLNGTHRAAANDLILMLAERQGEQNPRLIPWASYDSDKATVDLRDAVEACDFARIDELIDQQ